MEREEAEQPENEKDDRDGEHYLFSPSWHPKVPGGYHVRTGILEGRGEGLTMHMADQIERVTLEPSSKLETRRTGLVFLCLIVTTNFVPWMRLAEAGIDSTLPLSAAESGLAILSCLLAAVLVISAWLMGRRLPVTPGRLTAKARDSGLALALLAAGANLALAAVVQGRAGMSFAGQLKWFGPVWYGLVLPAGLMAAFFKGRASIPAPRLVRPATTAEQASAALNR